jgi:hypothetical protein
MLHVEVITDMNISQLVINGNSLISIYVNSEIDTIMTEIQVNHLMRNGLKL